MPTVEELYRRAMGEDHALAYVGQVTRLDIEPCYLEKGAGKVPYDPARHRQWLALVTIEIQPLTPRLKPFKQQRVAGADADWLAITIDSLVRLGGDLRLLKGCYVKFRMVPTDDRFLGSGGIRHEKRALQFVALYPDRVTAEVAAGLAMDAGAGGDDGQPSDRSGMNGSTMGHIGNGHIRIVQNDTGYDGNGSTRNGHHGNGTNQDVFVTLDR